MEPPPKPPVRPPNPKPAQPLPDYGPEPATTGLPLFDEALQGKAPKALLPIWHNYPWRKISHPITWTASVVDTIRRDGQGLVQTVPKDIYWYCPKYPGFTEDQRIAFWARFISILTEEESSLNPLAVYYEDTMSTEKDPIFSIGMLQLSIESSKQRRFGCSMIQVQDDLFDWNKNLSCGIRIISAMVQDDQAISVDLRADGSPAWKGISHDWGTLRDRRMRSDVGRKCLGEMVEQRRAAWIAESKADKNPALHDSEYEEAGEKYYERLLRFVNEFPLCYDGK